MWFELAKAGLDLVTTAASGYMRRQEDKKRKEGAIHGSCFNC